MVKPAPTPPSVTPSAAKRTVSPVGAAPRIVVVAAPACEISVTSFAIVSGSAYVPAPTRIVSPFSDPLIAGWIDVDWFT